VSDILGAKGGCGLSVLEHVTWPPLGYDYPCEEIFVWRIDVSRTAVQSSRLDLWKLTISKLGGIAARVAEQTFTLLFGKTAVSGWIRACINKYNNSR